MPPKTVHDDELLDRMLEAFADLGYEGTSIRELCRHLGVSHNMIHQRYQSKERAWHAAVDHGFTALVLELAQVLVAYRGDDELVVLRAAMVCYARHTMNRPALARIVHQESTRPGPRWDYIFTRYMEPIQQQAEGLITTLRRDGRVRTGPVEVAYWFLIHWGIGGLASFPGDYGGLAGSVVARERAAQFAVDVVLDGLVVRQPEALPAGVKSSKQRAKKSVD